MNATTKIQYVCAILLIVSSIILAFAQVLTIKTVNDGTLMYIAQAFLLAGSIFGLDYYTKKIAYYVTKNRENNTPGNQEQQPAEHS